MEQCIFFAASAASKNLLLPDKILYFIIFKIKSDGSFKHFKQIFIFIYVFYIYEEGDAPLEKSAGHYELLRKALSAQEIINQCRPLSAVSRIEVQPTAISRPNICTRLLYSTVQYSTRLQYNIYGEQSNPSGSETTTWSPSPCTSILHLLVSSQQTCLPPLPSTQTWAWLMPCYTCALDTCHVISTFHS